MSQLECSAPAGRHEVDQREIDQSEVDGRVRRAAMFSALNNMFVRVASIAVTAIIARILAPEDFGTFAVALVVYLIVSNVAELGVCAALLRSELDPDEVAPTATTIASLSGLGLAALMTVCAEPIAVALGSPPAASSIRVMALAVVLVGLSAVSSALLQREFRQGRQFVAVLAGFVPANAVLIVVALSGGGALAFAWSRVIGQLVTSVVIAASLPKRYGPGFDRATGRLLLSFGLPLAGANLIMYVVLNADYAIIGHRLGPVELGIYLFAFNISSWSAGLLMGVINSVAMPALSRLKDDRELLHARLALWSRLVVWAAAPIALISLALAGPLVRTVGGAQWTESAAPLGALTVSGALGVLCMLFVNLLVALGRTRLLIGLQLLWLALLAPAMLVAVDRWGIVGASWAHVVVVGGAMLPAYLIALRRIVGVTPGVVLRPLVPPVCAAGAAAAVAWIAAQQASAAPTALLLGAACGGASYLLLTLRQEPVSYGLATFVRVYRTFVARIVPRPSRSEPM